LEAWASLCEVLSGGVESEDEEVGSAKVDLVGGDEGDDVVEGVEEFLPSGGKRDGDGLASDAAGALAGVALVTAEDRTAAGVVVEAEGFVAEGGRAAGMGRRSGRRRQDVVTEDADVVEVVDGLAWLVHDGPPPWGVLFLTKSSYGWT
jgi:hypothetical protein